MPPSRKRVYDIDYDKLVALLQPTFLRQPLTLALLRASVTPVAMLHRQLLAFREEKQTQMSCNSQVCYLRKMLNDKFDSYHRRITISDAVRRTPLWLYREEEQKNTFLGTVMINREDVISNYSEFEVNIPATLLSQEAEIIAWLNYYKLATKFYTLKYF